MITENNLENILDNCNYHYRDSILYMDYDGSDYMMNSNIDYNDNFDCHLFGESDEITLTDLQKEKIYLKISHLLQDEINEIEVLKKEY